MILIVTALFPPEPLVSANLSFDIANQLSKNNDVVVISPKPSRPVGMSFSNNDNYSFKHIILESYTHPKSELLGRFRESYSFGKKVQKYVEINHKNIKVIYANTWPIFAQFLLVKISLKFKIPLILHIQDIYPESISAKIPLLGKIVDIFLKPVDKIILENSTKVITISNKMKDYLVDSRNINSNKILVVRNWQNDDKFLELRNNNKNIKIKSDKFIFMYVGSINPSARVDLIIHSFIKANLKEAKLVIAGNGSDKIKCMEIVKSYENQNIEFNEVTSNDIANFQSNADILILSLKKNMAKTALPSKLTAYMFSGKPVIASIDLDSEVSEIIQKYNFGFVVEPENEDKLSECLINAFNKDRKELINMGEKSFDFATKFFSKKYNLSKIIQSIESLKEVSDA